MLGVVGSSLKMAKFEAITPNTVAKRTQHVLLNNIALLRWHIAIVWPGLQPSCLASYFTRDSSKATETIYSSRVTDHQ